MLIIPITIKTSTETSAANTSKNLPHPDGVALTIASEVTNTITLSSCNDSEVPRSVVRFRRILLIVFPIGCFHGFYHRVSGLWFECV